MRDSIPLWAEVNIGDLRGGKHWKEDVGYTRELTPDPINSTRDAGGGDSYGWLEANQSKDPNA